jgi:Domain of unknown function (DUF4349)
VTTNDTDATAGAQVDPYPPAGGRSSFGRVAAALVRGHSRIAAALALGATAAVIGAAYLVGGPPILDGGTASPLSAASHAGPISAPQDAGSAASTKDLALDGTYANTPSDSTSGPNGGTQTGGQSGLPASLESTQIVRTGQLSLEVNDLDAAVSQAQAAVVGLGGYVDSSNRSGTGDFAAASITFRLPVARWDEALSDVRKIGSKVLSEQTGTSDVTTQVIDLDARISNLQSTETALQGIMTRATVITDVIAVENQLSDTQGQIEELTAERDHLKDQAAMSTLTVTFQLPDKTVITQATQDWTLGDQVDQAGAALVRIAQGLATILVWICLVLLPLALAALVLFGIAKVARRILRRVRRGDAAATV